MSPQARQPAGTPTGGQYANNPAATAPADVQLVQRRSIRDIKWEQISYDDGDEDYPTRIETVDRAVKRDSEFDRRVRRLLGVTTGAVEVLRNAQDVNLYGADTWESYSDIEVSVGKRTLQFDDMSDLFRRLELIDMNSDGPERITYTDDDARALHQKPATFTFPDGRQWRGRIGNYRPGEVLLVGSDRLQGNGRFSHTDRDGQHLYWVSLDNIDRIELH